jgi:hypothetical protein
MKLGALLIATEETKFYLNTIAENPTILAGINPR